MATQPAKFLFDVEQWRGSLPIQRMSFTERGVYQEMLNQQWIAKERSLPDDPEAVADLIAPSPAHVAEVLAAWPVVRRKFVHCRRDHTRIYNIKLEQIRRKQRAQLSIWVAAGRRGGKASARKRWTDKEIEVKPPLSQPVAKVTEGLGREGLGREGLGREKPSVAVDARSKRPIFSGQRLAVFEWQFDELSKMLGAHLDAFGLDEWFYTADGMAVDSGVVRQPRDWWPWLQQTTLAEAQRRGLPVALGMADADDAAFAALIRKGPSVRP